MRRAHTVLGAAIFAVIGTTYAVLLAFMATTAWEQYSAAEELARHEADLIGSIYHVSYGVAEPTGTAIRNDLMAYLAHVIDIEWPAQISWTNSSGDRTAAGTPRSDGAGDDAQRGKPIEHPALPDRCSERCRDGAA